jgi:hypothetical protein
MSGLGSGRGRVGPAAVNCSHGCAHHWSRWQCAQNQRPQPPARIRQRRQPGTASWLVPGAWARWSILAARRPHGFSAVADARIWGQAARVSLATLRRPAALLLFGFGLAADRTPRRCHKGNTARRARCSKRSSPIVGRAFTREFYVVACPPQFAGAGCCVRDIGPASLLGAQRGAALSCCRSLVTAALRPSGAGVVGDHLLRDKGCR